MKIFFQEKSINTYVLSNIKKAFWYETKGIFPSTYWNKHTLSMLNEPVNEIGLSKATESEIL